MKRSVTILMATTLVILVLAVHWGTVDVGPNPTKHRNETVILLHGLLTTPLHMTRIELALAREGFDVINWGYTSRVGSVQDHAEDLDHLVRTLPPDRTIHFVAFSLGSLIVRSYLTHYDVPNVGRFVMVGPPNHGSELADALYPHAWFRALAGPDATVQLRATNRAFFETVGTPPVEFGIIAGGLADGAGFSDVLPGDDDGRVSVASARLDGAADFIVLPHRHVVLLVTSDTRHQVLSFLTRGRFDHDREDGR